MFRDLRLAYRLFWASGAGLVTIMASFALLRPGLAGDFHQYGTLVCSDCHVMHYSEAHTMTGATPPPNVQLGAGGTWYVPLGPSGPHAKLLRQAESQLCLACHDGQADAPDVLEANTTGTYARAAGALSQLNPPAACLSPNPPNGHVLGCTDQAPGGTWSAPGGLQCVHCHDVHGNGYYRNLTPNPGTATGKFTTYLTGTTYSGTAGVQQIASSPLATQYSVGNIRYRQTQAGTTDFGLSQWCIGCHVGYPVAGSGNITHHPSDGATMAQAVTNGTVDPANWFSGLASRVPVVSISGVVPGTSGTSDNQVSCSTCHKAHGSTNPHGLIYDDATTAALEDGTSITQTCQQCHYQ